jgi:predicted RNA binding protein YcfA (HicA-like mRNA interferase family)
MSYQLSHIKEIREFAKLVEKQGWTVIKTKGDHIKWVSPSGAFIISASTPSDRKRFFQHVIKDMARIGYIFDKQTRTITEKESDSNANLLTV